MRTYLLMLSLVLVFVGQDVFAQDSKKAAGDGEVKKGNDAKVVDQDVKSKDGDAKAKDGDIRPDTSGRF